MSAISFWGHMDDELDMIMQQDPANCLYMRYSFPISKPQRALSLFFVLKILVLYLSDLKPGHFPSFLYKYNRGWPMVGGYVRDKTRKNRGEEPWEVVNVMW